MQEIAIQTDDGHVLTATEFLPDTPNGRVVVINAASGVRQEFYYNFAAYFCEQGFIVYTYDYRGIGKSLRTCIKKTTATYKIWAAHDFPAIIRYIEQQHPHKQYCLIGHSFGGNGIGMTPLTNRFEKIVTIASGLTYWRFSPLKRRWILWLFGCWITPLVSRLFGYFPAKLAGLGENLPLGVAKQWQRGILHPQSIVSIAWPHHHFYEKITAKIFMISIEDDWIAARAGVDALATHFVNADVTRRHIDLKESDSAPIGHINFFRRRFANNLWQIPLAWLQQ